MDELNSYQKNSIWASLSEFKEACRQAEKYLIEGDETGILYSRKLHFISSERKEIQILIKNVLKEIAWVKEKYQIESRMESIDRIILSQMSHCWTNLCDTQSKHLKGYGKLSQGLSLEIDQDMAILSDLSRQIFKCIENAAKKPIT